MSIPQLQLLESLLPEGMLVPTGFETVGHTAHLHLRDEHLPYKKLIAHVCCLIMLIKSYSRVYKILHVCILFKYLPVFSICIRKLWSTFQVVLVKNMPKIQTVVNKIDAIQNDFRTMELEVLAGKSSPVTTVIETGIHFQVDLAAVYILLFPYYCKQVLYLMLTKLINLRWKNWLSTIKQTAVS